MNLQVKCYNNGEMTEDEMMVFWFDWFSFFSQGLYLILIT